MTDPKRSPSEALEEAERRISRCLKTRRQVLDLRSLGLRELPESLRKLSWLTELDITDNDLGELPEWLGELTQLRQLEASINPLMSIPASLGRLSQLQGMFFMTGVST